MKDIPSMNFIDNSKKKEKNNVFTQKYYKNFFGALDKNQKNIKDLNSVYKNINLPDRYKEGILIQNKELIKKIREKKEKEKELEEENLLKKREKIINEKTEKQKSKNFFKEKNELIFQDPSYIKKEVEDIFKNYKKIKKMDILKDKNIYSKNKKKKKLIINRIIKNENTSINIDNILNRTYFNYIPNINWWDKIYLKKNFDYEKYNLILDEKKKEEELENNFVNLKNMEVIDFPKLPIVNKEEKDLKIPFFSTDAEIKKEKKKKKMEKQLEIQEKIKYGIIQPPPPKMKLSNFTKIFENETILNPTKIEKIVRAQIEERKEKHILHNENKKLTKEKKEDKKLRKIKKDMAKQLYIFIYIIEKIPNFEILFKIEQYVSKFFFNGFLLIPNKNFEIRKSFLVFESGKKFGKKFEKYIKKAFVKNEIKKNKNFENNFEEDFFLKKIWSEERKDHFYDKWRILRPKTFLEIENFFKEYKISNIFPIYLNRYLKKDN